MNVVLDTDVVVAALRSPRGASAALVGLLDAGRGELLLSAALLFEVEDVCLREKHREEAGLDASQVMVFLDALVAIARPVETHFMWRPQLRDPDDEMVLEVAVNGQADAIVTFNARDFGSAPEQFGIAVLTPGQALWRMKT